MLPAPARIAAPPRPKSRVSWNPAVPPPPVAGAAVGNVLADWLEFADGLGVADGLTLALGVADGLTLALGVADGLTLALGVVVLAVPLGRMVGVAEPDTAGENEVGVGEGEDAVQAETDAEAIMAKVAQQAAVNLALRPVPMLVVRTVIGPPYASGGRRTPLPGPGIGREIAAGPVTARADRRQVPGRADGHKGKAHRRHRH